MVNHNSISISKLNNTINVSERTIRNNINDLQKKEIITVFTDLNDLRRKFIKLNNKGDL